MAEVIIPTSWEKQVWTTKFWKEYIRRSAFDRYMGDDTTNIFVVISEAQTEGGKPINIPLIGRLRGSGVRGSQALEGNEEDLSLSGDRVFTDWRRNAVKVPKSTSYKSEIDLLQAARPALRDWAALQVLRTDIVAQLQGVVVAGAAAAQGNSPDTVIEYSTATAAQRNAYLVANSDRIIFGKDIANASSGVFATALGNIDSTNDLMTPDLVSKAKRMAQATVNGNGPAITPYMTDDGQEWYVMFCSPQQMRDLRTNATMVSANTNARERGENNPLFRGGDLLWDGVIIREVQEFSVVTGVGAGSINVAQAVLCGQAALAIAYGQMPRVGRDNTQDYEFRPAVFIEELIGIKKTSFNGVQYGAVSVWTAATPDV